MNMLTKWNPVPDLESLQNRMLGFLSRPLLPMFGEELLGSSEWSLPVDVSEDEREFLITAEIPEVKKEDVKVTLEDGSVRISGERKLEKSENGRRYHRIERAYGCFERSFVLPEGARGADISAEFQEGLLKVHIPKAEEERPKPVEIPVS